MEINPWSTSQGVRLTAGRKRGSGPPKVVASEDPHASGGCPRWDQVRCGAADDLSCAITLSEHNRDRTQPLRSGDRRGNHRLWVAFAGFFFGLTYGLLQIVGELAIFRREYRSGLSAGANAVISSAPEPSAWSSATARNSASRNASLMPCRRRRHGDSRRLQPEPSPGRTPGVPGWASGACPTPGRHGERGAAARPAAGRNARAARRKPPLAMRSCGGPPSRRRKGLHIQMHACPS